MDPETDAERTLKDAIDDCREAFEEWEEEPRPIIRASFVKHLVIHARADAGVRIHAARIEGRLDLNDARGPSGQACNALILRDCELKGEAGDLGAEPAIDARYSHLSRLSLKGCRADGIEVSGARIDGDLTLDRTGPWDERACWVKARDVRIGGSVTAREARLSLPWAAGEETPWPPKDRRDTRTEGNDGDYWSNVRAPFGLDLQGAQIGGSLVLQPHFESRGGVNIAGARIGGDLWCQGAYLESAEVGHDSVEALRAQSVDIRGHAQLGCDMTPSPADPGDTARREVAAASDRRNGDPGEGEHDDQKRFRAHGSLDFLAGKIGGSLWLSGAKLDGTKPEMRALTLSSATLSSSVYLDRAYLSEGDKVGVACEIPTIMVSPASIGGDLVVEGSADGPIEELSAAGLRVAGNLHLWGSLWTADMSTSVINGELTIGAPDAAAMGAVKARGVRVGSNLTIWGALGPIRAEGITVGGDLNLTGRLTTTWDFSGAVIDGDLALAHLTLGEDVVPSADLSSLKLIPGGSKKPPVLKLAGAKVGRTLRVNPLGTPPFPFHLATATSRIRTAALACYPGWRLAEVILEDATARSSVVAVLACLYRPNRRGDAVVLDGRSLRIHEFNKAQKPRLDTTEAVAQYLSLFCNYVWGDEGAFRITDPVSAGDPIVARLVEAVGRSPSDGSWEAGAVVEYGPDRFRASFVIDRSGQVAMVGDDKLKPDPAPETRPAIRYDPPLRWVGVDPDSPGARDVDWPISPPGQFEFTPISTTERWRGLKGKDIRRALHRGLDAGARPEIDLTDLNAASLSDDDGKNWGLGREHDRSGARLSERIWHRLATLRTPLKNVVRRPADDQESARSRDTWADRHELQLQLAGFEYGRIGRISPSDSKSTPAFSAEEDRSEDARMAYRETWLRAQYKQHPPTEDAYSPQPFQQLAKVWRAGGNFSNADAIARRKLELEKVRIVSTSPSSWWKRLKRRGTASVWYWGIQIPFGFGLKPGRALSSLVLFWLVGVVALLALSGALKVDASPVGTVVGTQGGTERVVLQQQQVTQPREEVPCGDHVNELIYPLDVAIPLVDLREESRCQFSIKGGWWIFDWGLAKSIYAIVGWLMLSGLIITLSGVVRRRIEA